MSKFDVQVRQISEIAPHPNADKLECARVAGYQVLIPKGRYKAGDLIVYLPEAAVLPEFVLRAAGLWNEDKGIGLCAGEFGNRVKPVKLRGLLSQGVPYPLSHFDDHPLGAGWYLQDADAGLWPVKAGDDVAGLLGVTKHIPPVPAELAGAVMPVGRHLLPDFDIEDIKKYPHLLQDGEHVFITEKLHGIMTGAVLLPEHEAIDGNRFFVFGKGLGHEGLAFIDDDANQDNVYLQVAHKHNLRAKLELLADRLDETSEPLFILGETFGIGVQDLGYGVKPDYRAFAIGAGYRGREQYLDYLTAKGHASVIGVDWVPELYRGPYSKEIVDQVIIGKETLTGKGVHIREGGVIEPLLTRYAPELGRVVLKAISPDYLTRPGNTTEYQ
jgi:RNA ligase (TIGR02306 family)